MIPARFLPNAEYNDALNEEGRNDGEGNAAWLQRVVSNAPRHRLILFGGCSLAAFRVRVAESHVRADLKPSFFSHAAVWDGQEDILWSVPLGPWDRMGDVSQRNGIFGSDRAAFDDVARFPNIACIVFPTVHDDEVSRSIEQLQSARLSRDMVTLAIRWLGYAVGADGFHNPLFHDVPEPSAAFVEAVFGQGEVDLTPGVDANATCPEALWQTARWWSGYYAERKGDRPHGWYCIGQGAAAVDDSQG